MRTLIFSFFAFLFMVPQAFSQYKVEWSADFSTGGQLGIDKAQFIIIDGEGNIIVTGVTNSDGLNDNITTIKYDKDGKEIWVAFYNGPGNYHDRPNGIAVDQFSNVYVTGGSSGDKGTATDFVTIKYNSGGIEQWASRFAAKGGSADESKSIAVDQNGNVYVTGHGSHIVKINSGQDWITIKYNTNGKQQWIATYDDGIVSDGATALTIDGIGNVYVTGQCKGPAYHIATIKYDTSGKKQWIKKYNGPAPSDDKPMDIKIDKLGFVYITGYSSEANMDYITIKYDNNGNEIWKKTFNGLMNMEDAAEKMLVDDNGNVFILGYSTVKKNSRNRCLIKYDNSGAEKWNVLSDQSVKRTDQAISGLSMAFDKEDNILVTGSGKIVKDKTATQMMVDCYSKDGTLLWQTFFAKENLIPVATALTMDGSGNIYVTGYIMGTKGFIDYCTVKFSR
jgi:hypothetical protein